MNMNGITMTVAICIFLYIRHLQVKADMNASGQKAYRDAAEAYWLQMKKLDRKIVSYKKWVRRLKHTLNKRAANNKTDA